MQCHMAHTEIAFLDGSCTLFAPQERWKDGLPQPAPPHTHIHTHHTRTHAQATLVFHSHVYVSHKCLEPGSEIYRTTVLRIFCVGMKLGLSPTLRDTD